MKKLLAFLLAAVMLLTLLPGMALAADAAPAVFSVYIQAGDAEPVLAKAYTADALAALAEEKPDGNGYVYYKGEATNAVVATRFVTLDALLTDAGVSFTAGSSLSFTCSDGPYTKFSPTFEDLDAAKFDQDGAEVPVALALAWGSGDLADGTVADLAATAQDTGSIRFVCGMTQAEKDEASAAGKRMPSDVLAITVVTAAPETAPEADVYAQAPDTAPVEPAAVSFSDVAADAWYVDAVGYCAGRGLFEGVGNGQFAPEKNMTGAELLTVLYRIAGGATQADADPWYAPQLAWAQGLGIVAADFDAAADVTREAFITMLYKTVSLSGLFDTAVTPQMLDALAAAVDYAELSSESYDALAWGVASGLIQGMSADTLTLSPASNVRRCELCTMLMRYYQGLVG